MTTPPTGSGGSSGQSSGSSDQSAGGRGGAAGGSATSRTGMDQETLRYLEKFADQITTALRDSTAAAREPVDADILDRFAERIANALGGIRAAVPEPLRAEQLEAINDYADLGRALQGPDVDPPDELTIGPDIGADWSRGLPDGFARPFSVDRVPNAPPAGSPIVAAPTLDLLAGPAPSESSRP